MSSNHSDLPALKCLLFECCFESIKAATESRFYTARETHLTTRALSNAMSIRESASSEIARPKSGIAETVAAVKAVQPNKKAKTPKTQRSGSGWSWGWGWTVGVITLAVLVQLVALGYYARNVSALKTLVDNYQAESAAEKQELKQMVLGRIELIDPSNIQHRKNERFVSNIKFLVRAPVIVARGLARPLWKSAAASHKAISKATGFIKDSDALSKLSERSRKAGAVIIRPFTTGFKASNTKARQLFAKVPSMVSDWKNTTSSRVIKSLAALRLKTRIQISKPSWSGVHNGMHKSLKSTGRGVSYIGKSLTHFGSRVKVAAFYTAKCNAHAAHIASHKLAIGTHKAGASLQKFGQILARASKPVGYSLKAAGHTTGTKIGEYTKSAGSQLSVMGKLGAQIVNKAASSTSKSVQRSMATTVKGVEKAAQNVGKSMRSGAQNAGFGIQKAAIKVNNAAEAIVDKALAKIGIPKDVQCWLAENWKATRVIRRTAMAAVLQ